MLRTFLAIEEHGSMAAAADRIALTQAAVGAQMRTLETLCHRQLFDRSARNIQLNEAGRAIIEQARSVIAAYDSLLHGVSVEDEIAGSVTIGATMSSIGFLAASVIKLRARYPGLSVHLVNGNSPDLERQVRAGEIDAAVIFGRPKIATLHGSWTPLYDEPLVLLVNPSIDSAGTPVTALLESHPFISFETGSLTGAHIRRLLRRMHVQVDQVLELNTIAAIADLVRQNVGISIVPCLKHAAWESDPQLTIRRFPEMTWRRPVGWFECGRQSSVTAIVKDHLLAAL
ncbi:LysR substrate-binding domain-containing protein [Paraburkholderia sp.]|uniref:LysR substrate-binding domain-containing protein n=1 Tax=Paraburkholderia sp. TaxID=1926495 RepID=UPI003C7A71F1